MDTQPAHPVGATSPAPSTALANVGIRAAGYLIDVIPAAFVGLLGLIPIAGLIMAGFVLAPYWLLRDITGASLGKLVLGLRVVRKDGQPASIGSRILRNVPLAIGPSLLMIPFLGYFLGPVTAGIILLVEVIFLLTQGERFGDRMAGTRVVRK